MGVRAHKRRGWSTVVGFQTLESGQRKRMAAPNTRQHSATQRRRARHRNKMRRNVKWTFKRSQSLACLLKIFHSPSLFISTALIFSCPSAARRARLPRDILALLSYFSVATIVGATKIGTTLSSEKSGVSIPEP